MCPGHGHRIAGRMVQLKRAAFAHRMSSHAHTGLSYQNRARSVWDGWNEYSSLMNTHSLYYYPGCTAIFTSICSSLMLFILLRSSAEFPKYMSKSTNN